MTEQNQKHTRQRVLLALRDWFRDKRGVPTYQQLADVVGVSSPSTIKAHIDALGAEGYLRVAPRRKHGRVEAVMVDSATLEPDKSGNGELLPNFNRAAEGSER
jgi:predicted ArsR family transcriptional regulator